MNTNLISSNYPVTNAEQEKAIALRNKILPLIDKPKYLLAFEIQKLFSYIDNSKQLMFFQMLWNTGARKGEILSLTRKDINLNDRYIVIHSLKRKNKHNRVIPIIDNYFLSLLQNHLHFGRFRDNELIFKIDTTTINKWLDNIVLKASIDGFTLPFKISPHTFRHSFAVHLLYNGIKPIELKNLLGHSRLNSTMIYIDILAMDIDYSNIKFND